MNWCPFALGFFALLAAAPSAFALASCPIRIEPPVAEPEWGREAARVREKLGDFPSAERDCREILVRVDGEGRRANVVLTTTDARTATRPVQGPDELEAVISALVVTVPPPDEPPQRAVVAARVPERDTTAAEPGSASATPHPYVLVLALSGGGRASVTASLVAPTFGGSIAGHFGHFETGLFGQHEPGYGVVSGTAPPGFALSGTAFGAFTGYRWPSAGLGLVAGLRAGAALMREQVTTSATVQGTGDGDTESEDVVKTTTPTNSPVEARVGAYVGLVVPAHARLGFRAEMALEGVAARFNETTAPADSNLPALPNWAASLQLGLEGGVL